MAVHARLPDRIKHQRISTMVAAVILLLTFLLLQASSLPIGGTAAWLKAEATSTPVDTLNLHGKVTDQAGKPLHALLTVQMGNRSENYGDVITDGEGNYSIQVPTKRKAYLIYAQEIDGRVSIEQDVIPSGYLDRYVVAVPTGGPDLQADITLLPGGAIWLKTYDEAGNVLFRQDVNNNTWKVGVYPLGSAPTIHPLQVDNHQENTFWGWRTDSDKNNTVLLVTPDQAVELWIHYLIPGAGTTYIHLDNDGKGYTVNQGGVLQVNFLFDAAKTEYRLYRERMDKFEAAGYTFSSEIVQWNAESLQAIADLTGACGETNLGECTRVAKTILSRTLRARENALLQAARQDIEKYRKADATVTILTCDGSPLGEAQVSYRQESQDFILGVGWPEKNQVASLEQAGFNGAIQESWWGEVIQPDGSYYYRDENFDYITASRDGYCHAHRGVDHPDQQSRLAFRGERPGQNDAGPDRGSGAGLLEELHCSLP